MTDEHPLGTGAVILAAGKGTRMYSDRAKVLHEAAGRTLLGWALANVADLGIEAVSVVVGHQSEDVAAACPDGVTAVVQEPQNGTGHATSIGLSGLPGSIDTVLVLPGDMPLLRSSTLAALMSAHAREGAAATVLSVNLDDPTGYGRMVRDGDAVTAIVEEVDATEEQRSITEVNTSVYVFDRMALEGALSRVGTDNAQGEQYLTDVIALLAGDGATIRAVVADSEEGNGVNTHGQLAAVSAALRGRINRQLMDNGVWMLDPNRVYIDADVVVAPGARLHPDTYLVGSCAVGAGAEIGPNAHLTDTSVGAGARVTQAVAVSATIGEDARVGPFAYLRPGAVLQKGSKVGTYVEVKASTIGEGSKVPHLSYVGDATIGKGSNIGAGTITVNYDGYQKHATVIGDNVRIGSDTMLVAPVTVGDNAYTGAGSVVTKDVPEGALAVERTEQKNVPGYADRRRNAEGDDA